jgi:hypothetical protein
MGEFKDVIILLLVVLAALVWAVGPSAWDWIVWKYRHPNRRR